MRSMIFCLLIIVLWISAAWAVLGGGNIVLKVSGAQNVLFSHDVHAGRSRVGCKECHYAIYTTRVNHRTATMDEMKKGKSCGACHNGTRAFNVTDAQQCSRCHNQ
ncbi:MAG: cytochrome c3 family protein [Nitrospirota bacterium]|nr:cytochrome c3 family protein [Nitrospirota bacterium]